MNSTLPLFMLLGLGPINQNIEDSRSWTNVNVQFTENGFVNYVKQPLTTKDESIRKYFKVKENETNCRFPIDFYCLEKGLRGCLMFDKKGNLVGFQSSFRMYDTKFGNPEKYNYSAVTNFVMTNFSNNPAYSVRAYFTNPEKLTSSGRMNIKETADGIWFYLDNKLVEIPRKQPASYTFLNFYRQGYVKDIGVFYFYKINKEENDCKKMYPLFVIYQFGNLIGYGFAAPLERGLVLVYSYEYLSVATVKRLIPNRPKCLEDVFSELGCTAAIVYLIDKQFDFYRTFHVV